MVVAEASIAWGWLLTICIVLCLMVVYRLLARITAWTSYWHEEWLRVSRDYASVLDRCENLRAEVDRLRQQVLERDRELARRREKPDASVPLVWSDVGAGVVSPQWDIGLGDHTSMQPVSGVQAALGQCSPGAAAGGGGESGFTGSFTNPMGAAEGDMSTLLPLTRSGFPRGPYPSDRERGSARGGEPAAPAPAVQSSEGV